MSRSFPILIAAIASIASNASVARAQEPSAFTIDAAATTAAVAKARAFAFQNTHEPLGPLGKLAASQLQIFGKAMGIPSGELQNPLVASHGTFVMAVTANWVYRADVSGNQTFKPVSNLPYTAAGLGEASSDYTEQVDTARLSRIASELAERLAPGSTAALTKIVVKKEVLALVKCSQPHGAFHNGRYLVRLCQKDSDRYFQVLCDKQYAPIRIETNLPAKIVDERLFQAIPGTTSSAKPLSDTTASLKIGAFFDPSEYRFKVDAYSYLGESFLSAGTEGNPFGRDNTDNDNFNFVDVERYRGSKDYRFWCCVWWNLYGRVGSARGNWDSGSQTWDRPDITTAMYPLKDYGLVGGEPQHIRQYRLSDHVEHPEPFAVSRTLDEKFYDDLESCNVGIFFTHGGPIDDRLQLRRGLDVWFCPGNSHVPFGSHNLRHLIFNSCATMESFQGTREGAKYLTVFTEWMPARFVKGLRTVSGVDGVGTGLDRDGWRFYGRYNQGDSISDSWALASVDECLANAPTTVGYGSSPAEAMQTLSDDRFSADRIDPKWSVASIWKSITKDWGDDPN